MSLEQRQWLIMSILDTYNGNNTNKIRKKLGCVPKFDYRYAIRDKENVMYEDLMKFIYKPEHRSIFSYRICEMWGIIILGKRNNMFNRVFINCELNNNERRLIHKYIDNGFTNVRENIKCIFYTDTKVYPRSDICYICEKEIYDINAGGDIRLDSYWHFPIYIKRICDVCVDTLYNDFVNVKK